jgi:ribosomal protein L9
MVRSDLHHTSKIFRMKVKLLKDHGVLGLKDDVVEVSDDQGLYLKRMKVATDHKEHKEEKSTHSTKEDKEAHKRKDKVNA